MDIQTIPFKSTNIRFSIQGKGKAVVLLHGYLESLEIWNGFAEQLSKKYQIIAIDLLGHGQSGIANGEATVELMAESIKAVLDFLGIEKAIIIGHSMGGYAMLAFTELWPEMVSGISLYHSISWADTQEKREARDKEIELVKQGSKQLVFNVNVPKSFADENREKFKMEMARALNIAAATTNEGIIAALNGMKARKDRTFILENTIAPVFFAIGKKDNYIPVEKIMPLTNLPKNKYVAIFENSGHMSFIEEKEKAINEITYFIEKC